MCSKHVEALNKLIVKQEFCASSWLITEINILIRTVSKTSKKYEANSCFSQNGDKRLKRYLQEVGRVGVDWLNRAQGTKRVPQNAGNALAESPLTSQ